VDLRLVGRLITVCVAHFAFHAISDAFWAPFWKTYIILLLAQCIPASVWFTIGGVLDIRSLLKMLQTSSRDPLDDGRVAHETVDEEVLVTH
jgi:SSS family solute:Na+ symporter